MAPRSSATISRELPASEEFSLESAGPNARLHVALNEAFVPGPQGGSEILEFPAAKNLEEWQQIAQRISPEAELVLYHPDLPRSESQVSFLGTSFILEASSEQEAKSEAERRSWRFLRSLGPDGPFLVAAATPLQALQTLRGAPADDSLQIAGNFRRIAQKRFIPNDPLFPLQWHLRNVGTTSTNTNSTNTAIFDIKVTSAWDIVRGSNVVVGIADDGLETSHPDLALNLAPALHYNWRGGATNDPSPSSALDSHGTALAGLVAGRGNNRIGISGVAPAAKLAGLRVLSGNTATDADLISMLKWKADDIAIKNMSYSTSLDDGTGFGQISPSVKQALTWATQNGRQTKGTVLVQANGNGNLIGIFLFNYFPKRSWDDSQWDESANSPYVISVAAIDKDGQPAYYTEYGANIAVAAPSSKNKEESFYYETPFFDGLYTTFLNGRYGYFGGTSGSAALVSGVAALMLEANPSLGWRDVKQILMQTANQPSTSFRNATVQNKARYNFSYVFGAGLVDATAAVQAASEHQNLPPMVSYSKATKTKLRPEYGDTNGKSVTLELSENPTVETVALTFSATAVWNFYSLVFYVRSPSGTEVRMNCVRWQSGGVREAQNVVMTTPFFWGEPGKGNWTIRAVDEAAGGGVPGDVYKTISSVGLTWFGSTAPVAPANDAFDSPTVITENRASFTVNNAGATRQTKEGEPNHAGGKGGGSLWWRFEPSANGFLTLDTSASRVTDTLLAVYTGNSLTNLTVMASSDDITTANRRSRVTRLPLEVGQAVYIAVDGKNRERGEINLNVLFEPGAVYDNFAEPKQVLGTTWTESRNLAGTPVYSAESGERPHAGQAPFKSIWFRWTPGVTGTAEIFTTNSTFPTVLAVYQGSRVNALSPIASNAGNVSQRNTRVQFGVRPGQTYHVALDGRNQLAGTYTVQGLVHAAPPLPDTNRPAGSPTVRPPVAPTNQLATNALTVSGSTVRTSGNNLNAALGTSGGPSVWYKWTAPKSGTVAVDTSGSGFDTFLAVYTEAMASKGSNDNSRAGVRWSRVVFDADASTTYYFEVSGARGASGRFNLNVQQ